METPIHTYPIQVPYRNNKAGCVPAPVYLAAYEVYAEVHGGQQALLEGNCRGGFGMGEMIAFLYARAFPRSEWRARTDEAFRGMKTGD